jgi:asparagine synthase (glutamine-hydrolysing)
MAYSGDLEGMRKAVAHRGPDAHGVWQSEGMQVGLAHTRLAIRDLSPRGSQPMWDAGGHCVIVFNGEIYNYEELAERVRRAGVVLRGSSDTEVLINLYALHGRSVFAWLNGIFSIAIWDTRDRSLVLARDGLGVKPLYWSRTQFGLVFASELKALSRLPGVDRSLDHRGMISYISLCYAPGPLTPMQGIRKWTPGTMMRFSETADALEEWTFYRKPIGGPKSDLETRELGLCLLGKLDDAVSRQMVADVPVGCFLSGGLDSTAIVSAARRLHPGEPLPCYTIRCAGTDGSSDGFVEDLPYAREAAAMFGCELREVEIKEDDLCRIDEMVWMLDEPQPDPAALNALFICRQARAHGIKVLLSGAGGDDIFSGYRRHTAIQSDYVWDWLPRFMRQSIARGASHLPVGTPLYRRLRKLLGVAALNRNERLASYFLWLAESDLGGLLSDDTVRALGGFAAADTLAQTADGAGEGLSPLERMLFLEQSYFLTDHNLNYTDKMSMAVGVEVRVPFLDPELMDFARTIPDRFKVKGGVPKWIFKEAMCSRVPRSFAFRKKSGFGAPLRRWIHGALAERFEEYINSQRILDQGLFDRTGLQELLRRDQCREVDAAYPLFAVLAIDSWIRQF